jgi:hypothetical protein
MKRDDGSPKKEGKQPVEQDRFPGCVQKCLGYLDEKTAQRLQDRRDQ